VKGSVHLRGIVIAGVLAAVALALGLVTLAMNQTASQAAPPKTIIPLKDRHRVNAVKKTPSAAKKVAPKKKAAPLDPNYVAALKAGLPRSVAHGLQTHGAVVVELTSASDPVAEQAAGEAKAGAALGGASYVAVNVDRNGGDVEVLTRVLGKLPVTPAALIYTRPAKLATTLPGFNDRTVVQQAVANALPDVPVAAGTDWAAKANAICAASQAQLATLTGSGKTDFHQAFSTIAKQQAQLDKLTAPPGGAAAIKAANAKLRLGMKLLEEDATKHLTGEKAGQAFIQALAALEPAFATYNSLGATVCAGTSSS